MGCPREAEPAAGGEWRRWSSGARGRERPDWGGAVEDEEANGAVGLGRERAKVRAPRWTEVSAALMEDGVVLYAREEVRGGLL
jgi:hypothetical protein